MKKEIFVLDVGVLLSQNDEEFECYQISNFYEDKGFYDENRLTFLTYEEAKECCDNYVLDGNDNTYGIIYSFIANLDDNDLDDIIDYKYCEQSLENPTIDLVLYFIHKQDNTIIKEINNYD